MNFAWLSFVGWWRRHRNCPRNTRWLCTNCVRWIFQEWCTHWLIWDFINSCSCGQRLFWSLWGGRLGAWFFAWSISIQKWTRWCVWSPSNHRYFCSVFRNWGWRHHSCSLDGESPLKQCQGTWLLSVDQKSFDILQDIQPQVASLPIKVSWKWVEGHRDDVHPWAL